MANYQDYEKIEALIRSYFEAVGNADIDKLKTIFHEKASMNGYLGKDVVIATPEVFLSVLSSKPSMKSDGIDCHMVIKHIQVCGNIAAASIFVDNFFGSSQIQDYFHLLKLDGEWKILCKTFTTL